MRASGVICEFNPIHTGHAHLLSCMREAVGDDGCVICLMSGRFVQRGTAAMADPYLRAEMALSAGADLVLELPFPWSAAGAEHFARAGVRMLARLGVESIAFGSESGDIDLLTRAAAAVAHPAFSDTYAALCREGRGTTAAYIEAVRRTIDGQNPLSNQDISVGPSTRGKPPASNFPASNDLLGIAYLRALSDLPGAKNEIPRPRVIRREGADYRDGTLPTDTYPSATALRRIIREATEDPLALEAILDGTMPDEALKLLLGAIRCGNAPLDGTPLLAFYHAHYRLADPTALATCAECGGGLAAHMVRCAQKASSPKAFFDDLRTRQYTDARLRRALLFGVIGVTEQDLRADPTHTTLLAATSRGCAYLAELRRAARTQPMQVPDCRLTESIEAAPSDTAATVSKAAESAEMAQKHRDRDRGATAQNHSATASHFAPNPLNQLFCRSPFPVVTKPADAPAGRQTELALRADALFTLCFPTPRAAGELLRKTPVIRR